MGKIDNVARVCKALSVPTRVSIIGMLKVHSLCVGALSARLKVTQGAVSQHLRVLRDLGIVDADKKGYFVHYRLNEKCLARWRATMQGFLGLKSSKRTCCSHSRKGE